MGWLYRHVVRLLGLAMAVGAFCFIAMQQLAVDTVSGPRLHEAEPAATTVEFAGLRLIGPFPSEHAAADKWHGLYNNTSRQHVPPREIGSSILRLKESFYFTEPIEGTATQVRLPHSPQVVATIHTHADLVGYDAEHLSRHADIEIAETAGIRVWLSSPAGSLKVFDPASGETESQTQLIPVQGSRMPVAAPEPAFDIPLQRGHQQQRQQPARKSEARKRRRR
jgi:hypothetical protein